DDGGAQPGRGAVAQEHIAGANAVQQARDAIQFRTQGGGGHLAFRLAAYGGELGRGEGVHRLPQRLGTTGFDQDLLDAPGGVVAGSPGDGPVLRQLLVGGEDLLHHGPDAAGGAVQPVQVPGGVGEAVRVVDEQGVDRSGLYQFQQQAVGAGEDILVLHPQPDEGVHIEKPAVVDLPGAPVGQPVVLLLEQVGQRQVFGTGPQREAVIVVGQYRVLGVQAVL